MKSSVIIHFGVGHENETIRAMLDYLGFLREASQKSPRLWWVVTVVISAASFLMTLIGTPRVVRLYWYYWAILLLALIFFGITAGAFNVLKERERRFTTQILELRRENAEAWEKKLIEVRCKREVELLTTYIEQGQQLMRRCRTEKDLVAEADAVEWAAKAEQLIELIFDTAHVSLFRSAVGVPMGGAYWPTLENRHVDGFVYVRVYRLQCFVEELQARLGN